MITSIESRLWLAVHLLYPNASQAFDVYHKNKTDCDSCWQFPERSFKAGGPNYLLQFVLEKTITENTMRRGFVGD